MIRSTLLLLAGCCVVSLPNGQPPTPPAAGALVVHQILPDVLRPVRVAYDPRGNLLVLSEGDNALEIYDTRLQLVKRIGRLGSAPGESDLDIAQSWAEDDRTYDCYLGVEGHRLTRDARATGW